MFRRRISLARHINYRNTFLSDEHDCLKSGPIAVGVVSGVIYARCRWRQSYPSHPDGVYMYIHIIIVLLYMEIPDHCPALLLLVPYPHPWITAHRAPLLLVTLRARWGSRVYQFSGNTFARMTHWEIGKRPTSIIKTRVHYTYLIPRRGAAYTV